MNESRLGSETGEPGFTATQLVRDPQAVLSWRQKNQTPRRERTMRSWPLALIAIASLAAATAHAADPGRIRASWVVAPSDWTPLLLEKPDLMRHNGKSYAFETLRF